MEQVDHKLLSLYLQPTYFMDFDHPKVKDFINSNKGSSKSITENAIALYYAVRDQFRYDPYEINIEHEGMKASNLLEREVRSGYCCEKSNLFVACCRAIGIPGRLGFANVRNHIGTEKLEKQLGTDVLVFHGYAEIFIGGKWVKCTPVFNKELCDKLGVAPLEFDGKNDSIFQEYDNEGGRFMEYLHFHGSFHDFPHDLFLKELATHYKNLFPGIDPQKDVLMQVRKKETHV